MKKYLTWGALIAVVLALSWQALTIRSLRKDVRAQAFKADSAIAVNDTTRPVNDAAARLLTDAVKGVEKRALQLEIKADALDRALRRETQAKTELLVAINALRQSGSTTPVTDNGDVRTASFSVDSVPYHAKAVVWLPPAPNPGKFDLSVTIDKATIGARIQCGKAVGAGVRPATVTLTTPSWLTADIGKTQFEPEVCNPSEKGFPWGRLGIAALAGLTTGIAISR